MDEKDVEHLNYLVDKEIICNEKYCPWWQDHHYSPSCPNCEGSYCEEAYDNYIAEVGE